MVKLFVQPCHKGVIVCSIRIPTTSTRKVVGRCLSRHIYLARYGMNSKGVGIIAIASTQVCGLKDGSRLQVGTKPCHKGVVDGGRRRRTTNTPVARRLRSASSVRKVGGIGISRYINLARCGMNSNGVGSIVIASTQVGGLEGFKICAKPRHKGVRVFSIGRLCPASSTRKVGGSCPSCHINLARCGMNSEGVGIIVTASSQVSGLVKGFKICTKPCHKGVIVCSSSGPTTGTRKVVGRGMSRHIDIARWRNSKGVCLIRTASSQVSGLENLGKLFVQLCHEGVRAAAIGCLRPARSVGKVVGLSPSSHVDFTRLRMNSNGVGIIGIASTQIGRLQNRVYHNRQALVCFGYLKAVAVFAN